MKFNETSFPYRMLLKAIKGEISEDKLERILKKYFKLRTLNLSQQKNKFPIGGSKQLKLIHIYGINCVFCGEKTIRDDTGIINPLNLITTEHILPKSKGGANHIDNCCISCMRCNSTKESNILPKLNRSEKKIISASERKKLRTAWEKFYSNKQLTFTEFRMKVSWRVKKGEYPKIN